MSPAENPAEGTPSVVPSAAASGTGLLSATADDPASARRKHLIAVSWAILIITLFYAYAMVVGAGESTYEIQVRAFDPRHPIAGQYLEFRYDWPLVNGPPRDPYVGDDVDMPMLAPGPQDALACVCLPDGRSFASDPAALRCDCGDSDQRPSGYDTRVNNQSAYGPGRFFIPEDQAERLGQLLIERRVTMLIKVGPLGDAVPVELLIDGVPWREAGG